MAFEGFDNGITDGWTEFPYDEELKDIGDAINASGLLEDIWRAFSDENYCASFLSPYTYDRRGDKTIDPEVMQQFEEWLMGKIDKD